MTQNTIVINGVPVYVDSAALISLLSNQKKPSPLMSEYVNQWFESFKKKKLRPRTQVTYDSLIRTHIKPFFGDKPVGDIDVSTIQQFYDSKNGLSKSTVRQCKILLHQIFNAAIEDNLIDHNPTESVRLTYSGRVTERQALTQLEIKDVIRQMVRLKGSDHRLLAIMIYTGVRRGEACGLRWEDIDFDSNMIHIKRAVSFVANQPLVGQTKSKAGIRDIPLLPELKAILEPYRREKGYLVGRGEEPVTERAYICAFNRIIKKMDLHGATAHIFRHTFLTMAMDVVDLKTLQTIAGHSSHALRS